MIGSAFPFEVQSLLDEVEGASAMCEDHGWGVREGTCADANSALEARNCSAIAACAAAASLAAVTRACCSACRARVALSLWALRAASRASKEEASSVALACMRCLKREACSLISEVAWSANSKQGWEAEIEVSHLDAMMGGFPQ